jgi:hypothetical protein
MSGRYAGPMPTRLAAAALCAALVVAACGTAASPSPSPAAPTSSPPAGPSAAPSSSASPSLVAGGPLVELAVAKLNSDPLVTHFKETATGDSAGRTVIATLEGDISGKDMAYHLSGTSAGQAVDFELVLVGDTAWGRQGGGAWSATPAADVKGSIDSLVGAIRLIHDPAQLADLGPQTIEGRDLRHLTAAVEIPYSVSTGAKGRYDAFDIWVEADGTPVLVSTAFSGELGSTRATGTTEIRFSNFGGPITIVPPVDAPSLKP